MEFSRVREEIDTNFGVVDILVAISKSKIRLSKGYKLSIGESKALACLSPRYGRHLDEISAITLLSPTALKRSLYGLKVKGIVRMTKDGKWIRVKASAEKQITLCAIEAKISDWKSGLRQAVRYKSFADKVIVAMPAERIGPARAHLSLFRINGVGLLAVSEKEKPEWVLRPRQDMPFLPYAKILALNRLMSLRIRD